MYKNMKQKAEPYIKRRYNRSIWKKIVQMMACVVVFCTTYALILPAITVEKKYSCGYEMHEHSEMCFEERADETGVVKAVVCGLEEHIHDETCEVDADTKIEIISESEEAEVEEEKQIEEETEIEDKLELEEDVPEIEEKTEVEEEQKPETEQPLPEKNKLLMAGTKAATANVTLNFTSWSEYNPISFPQGNNYTCPVGSIITIKVSDSSGNYQQPNVSVTGGELVSVNYTCGTPGHTHGWCGSQPLHTFVVRVTSTNVKISASVQGANWTNNSVSIDTSGAGGGGTEPEEPDIPDVPDVPVVPDVPKVPNYPYHPAGVHTGSVHIERLRFYNLCENGDNGVSALAGCVFEIEGDNGYKVTVISEDDPEVHLPTDIPDGTYTITEISAPAGYMRDTQYQRTFAVIDGTLVSDNNIGTFINHNVDQLNAAKTAEVEDYNHRIYQILLSAESHMRMYEMDPIDVLFVVDQSNSMLFPSGLEETGKTVTLNLNGNNNINNIERLNLDKRQMYYIISDPQGTSTVWALWYNGHSWIYQDASYYAKAKQNNQPGYQDPNERAIFPENRSYQDQKSAEASGTRSNGGGLGYSLVGSGLGNYLDKQTNDTLTFEIYQATDEYNRLHYLEEALTNMIYELADVNSKNRVTLTEFTKEVDEANDCMGPLELTPANADALVAEVRSINTSGGTRQDIALKHTYENHLNNSSQGFSGSPQDTYTILITDGAPVLSSNSGIENLGSPNDAASTTANSVYAQIKGYAQLVRGKSTLMTVGLGMDDVEAGKDVLEQIASNDEFFCALDNAAELVKSMQRLLFDAFKPKESIEIFGDIVDEISNSFYPIAWIEKGAGTSTGHQILVQDAARDWILLEAEDWITLDGKYAAAGSATAAGQLLKKEDGTYYIQWLNEKLSESYQDDIQRIAWVPAGSGAGTGRTVIASDGARDWILLNTGDWISQQGQYYSGTPSYWNQRSYGQVTSNGNGYYIRWGSSANGNNRLMYSEDPWKGTFYVKAKEDFIGGNAIETNKTAKVTTHNGEAVLDTPTVNVRLLDFNEMNSEVIVYLGDLVNESGNSPLDSLKQFYYNTEFTKLISDGGDVLNKVSADSAEGLEDRTFTLKYAMDRDLTEEEWQRLIAGENVNIDYMYDNQSSKGPVGYFTFRLEKTGMDGATPAYEEHEATAACQPRGQPLTESCRSPAETYTLHITYTALRLGERGRPETNVHNGGGSPGIEVGTGTTLANGLGVMEKKNTHEVHVISGSIEISKKFEAGLTAAEDQTFSFVLHRIEDGEDTSKDVIRQIVVPGGKSTGSSKAVFDGLRRGTYMVTEAVSDAYMVKEIEVLGTTNCFSVPEAGKKAEEITFTMGNNAANENVIGRFTEDEQYTSYIDPVNGVYGAAEFNNKKLAYEGKIPVEKVWDDGLEPHIHDTVYVVLYKDGASMLNAEGQAYLLKLDASTNWKGNFVVALENKDDKVENYNYEVREVSRVSDEKLHEWQEAVLQNDGTTVLYYERALEEGAVLGVDGHGYMVQYKEGENGEQIVTNYRAFELPKTGGTGTYRYTLSGLLMMIIAALMYGCIQRYSGERRRK